MKIEELIGREACTCWICGHVNPDGDCVGTASALFHYIKKNMPWVNVELFLEEPRASLLFLPTLAGARFTAPEASEAPDLLLSVDVSSMERVALLAEVFPKAKRTLCIDHHESNAGIADVNVIDANAASCAEVLYRLLDSEKIDVDCATALFTGIVFDSGVFQYKNTQPETLRVAADLMARGVDANAVIDDAFNRRTFPETKALGFCLANSTLHADGKVIATMITQEKMRELQVSKAELDQIVAQLRYVENTEVAIFLYEIEEQRFKASLRSNGDFDVAALAGKFGGGGHRRAAGCVLPMPAEEALPALLSEIEKEL